MFDIGIQELIVVFVVALLVFGPKRLPEIGKTLGKFVLEIRKGINEARIQMESGFGETENQSAQVQHNVVAKQFGGSAASGKDASERGEKA